MDSLVFVLLLSVGLHGCSLTSASNSGDWHSNVPGVVRASGRDEFSSDVTKAGNVCRECTEILGLLADLLSNADIETKMIDGIDIVCDHLPGSVAAAQFCREEAEKLLPKAIAFLTAVKPAEACKIMGLCSSCVKQEKMLRYFAKQALQAAAKGENGRTSTQCSLCLFILKTLEDLLPIERTEAAVVGLLMEICNILPTSYQDKCQVIVEMFVKSAVDAILSFATPEAICNLLHLCEGHDVTPVDACALMTHRCKDLRTALRCGTYFYCQRFAWKPRDYNTL